MNFKVGDYVIYNNYIMEDVGLKLGEIYQIVEVNHDGYVALNNYEREHSYKYWNYRRFSKVVKRRDNSIVRKICKVYPSEETGYIFVEAE